jgi:hypothetical protein
MILNKMKTITVSFAKWRSVLMLFINLLYLLIVFSFIFFDWRLLFLVTPMVLFLGWNVRRAWQELIGKKPALIIDKEGIVDHTRWYSLGRVGWEEVDLIKEQQFFLLQDIRVIFKDPKAVIQKEKNPLKRLVQNIQLVLKKTPMLLDNRALAISQNELAALLKNIDFENPDFVDMSAHLIDDN